MQQKVIKVDNKCVVLFEDGTYLEKELTNEEFEAVRKAETEEEVFKIMNPQGKEIVEEYEKTIETVEKAKKSNILVFKDGGVVYWKDIEGLSMPQELVEAVLEAEEANDEIKLETYKNFWTLMALNPNEECRKNLYWFLQRNGLVLSRCGFFVAYRNVVPTDKLNDEGDPIYTDAHSGTTHIEIGKVVTMPREKCDCDSNVTCSRGLHLGARTWLKQGYFGQQGLVCLCNPADVVAVPKLDHYGKLRTCAYLPIEKAEFDSAGDVIPFKATTGFDTGFVTQVLYEGLMGTEEDSPYRIEIPEIPGLNRAKVIDTILDIARECITKRIV